MGPTGNIRRLILCTEPIISLWCHGLFLRLLFCQRIESGLWDNQVNVAYKPSSKVNLSLAYHYFSITGDVYEGNDKLSKGLGSELDFQVDWVIMKDVKLSAGYSTMLGTNTMKVVKGGNPSHWQDWGWLSININPTIFTNEMVTVSRKRVYLQE